MLGLIRALQGSTSQSRMDGPPLDDPSFDDQDDHHRDFSPTDKTGTYQDGINPETRHEQARTTDTVFDW